MINTTQSLQFKKSGILLTGLAMAIGWGIRGNFGHQYGAAFAGCLGSITMCLLSGREDWKNKVLYFAFFGSIGWGFGATISYMQVISYCESGQIATQYFGYTCLFIIGFIWASLGVAGTAIVAAAEPEKLMRLFKVILYVFAAWFILDRIEDPLANALQPEGHFDDNASRQLNPLYWLDATYLPPTFALIAACIYDLNERREKNILWLPLFIIAGAFSGWLVQHQIISAGWEEKLSDALTFHLGDLSYLDPQTHLPAYRQEDLLTNWPQWFSNHSSAIGWFVGIIAGTVFYFIRFGKFRDGSSLIVCMGGGWLVFFILFPVLGSLLFEKIGGIRMTPPRSDDWAGMTGVFFGLLYWLKRNNYLSVATAAIIAGTIGGLGFSGIEWLKQLMMAAGSPRIFIDENVISSWSNWQHQNWHSFLEQCYGLVNGIAIAAGMGLLLKRAPVLKENHSASFRKWMLGICVVFTLLFIPYVNILKNVESFGNVFNPSVWTKTVGVNGVQQTVAAEWDVPYIGHLPGFDFLHFTPEGWFNITWFLLLALFILLIRKHFQKPLAIIPPSWTGRSQLIVLILLWTMIWGNFDRNIIRWTADRLLTDWVVIVDAIVLTYFILTLPASGIEPLQLSAPYSYKSLYKKAYRYAFAALIISAPLFLISNRLIYHYPPPGLPETHKHNLRFGPDADWRVKPILKNKKHN